MVKAIILASGLAAVAAAAPQFWDDDFQAPDAAPAAQVAPKFAPAPKGIAPQVPAPAVLPVPVPVGIEVDVDEDGDIESATYGMDDDDYKKRMIAKRQILADLAEGTASVAGDIVSGGASLLGDVLSPVADIFGLGGYGYGYDRAAVAQLAKRDPQLLADLLSAVASAGGDLLGGAYSVTSDVASNVASAGADILGLDYDYKNKAKRQIVGDILNGVGNIIDAAEDDDDEDYYGRRFGYGYRSFGDRFGARRGGYRFGRPRFGWDDKKRAVEKRQILADAVEGTASVLGDVVSGGASVLGDVLSIPADILGLGDYGYGYDDYKKKRFIPVGDLIGDIFGSDDSDYGYGYDDYKKKRSPQILGSIVSDVADTAADILGLGDDSDYDYGYDYKQKRQLLGGLLGGLGDVASDLLGSNYGPDVVVIDEDHSDYGYGRDYKQKRQLLGGLLGGLGDVASDLLGSNYGPDVVVVDNADDGDYYYDFRQKRYKSKAKRQILSDAVESTASVAGDILSGGASVLGDLLAIPADILGLGDYGYGSDYGYGYDKDETEVDVVAIPVPVAAVAPVAIATPQSTASLTAPLTTVQKRQLLGWLSGLFNGGADTDDVDTPDYVEAPELPEADEVVVAAPLYDPLGPSVDATIATPL